MPVMGPMLFGGWPYDTNRLIRSKVGLPIRSMVCVLVAVSSATLSAQSPYISQEQREAWHTTDAEPAEPFRIVGNIYFVGAKGLASYLITTPEGHILHDTGTVEMHDVIRSNVETLGFKMQDIKFMLHSHAHVDHMQGHAAMKRATGAQIVALGGDAVAIESGQDNSALGDEAGSLSRSIVWWRTAIHSPSAA